MFVNFICAVLDRIDRWTGAGTRPPRRVPLLPVFVVVAGCALAAGYLHSHRWSTLVLAGLVMLSGVSLFTRSSAARTTPGTSGR